VDTLVATESAFQLGPWIAMARSLAAPGEDDCGDKDCPAFYEWNARVQLTTWNPTPAGATKIPGGPVDYASKHWSGLIADYYAVRSQMLVDQALADAAQGHSLNQAAVDLGQAQLACVLAAGSSELSSSSSS
jgi:alpha-N-acetylglucosaminidase